MKQIRKRASLLFTLTYLIEGVTRTGYDAWQQAISLLSLGPGGFVQQVNFVIFGILMLCSAFGWRTVLKGGRAETWFPLLRGLAGLSLILVGIFSQDPVPGYPPGAVMTATTFHAVIHVVFSFVTITSLAVSDFVIARRFAVEPRWQGWATYSVITGVLIIVFIAIFGAQSGNSGATAGLFERLAGGVNTLWGILVFVKIFFISRR